MDDNPPDASPSDNQPQRGVEGSDVSPSNDKFRHGKILKFFPHLGYGFVRDQNGKEIYFHWDEIRFVGEKRDRSYLVEGAEVGFDVGLTSRGLRVTHLKVY